MSLTRIYSKDYPMMTPYIWTTGNIKYDLAIITALMAIYCILRIKINK